ncbi:hypothetical protein, partial [Haloarcula salina]
MSNSDILYAISAGSEPCKLWTDPAGFAVPSCGYWKYVGKSLLHLGKVIAALFGFFTLATAVVML